MDYQELRTALVTKGKADEDRARHHIFFFVEIDGKTYRATKFSHGARGQISKDLQGLISRQMRLTTKELSDFVSCVLKREHWLRIWRERKPAWRSSP